MQESLYSFKIYMCVGGEGKIICDSEEENISTGGNFSSSCETKKLVYNRFIFFVRSIYSSLLGCF